MASNLRVDSIVPSTSANVSIGTATGGVTIPGDLGIAGVLTYEDVTNIDSVGVITARSGVKVTGGDILLTGADGRKISFAGDGSSHYFKMDNSFNGPVINGYGGIKFETAGTNERLRIDSSGHVMIGTTTEGFATYGDQFTIANSGHCGMTIRSGTSSDGNIYFSDGTSGADEVRGFVEYNHTSNFMQLGANGAARLRIDSNGNVTKPNQPCFDATVSNGPVSGGNDIVFNSASLNIGTHYSTSNGRFTAPVTGQYFFYYGGLKNNNSNVCRLKLYKNGSSFVHNRELRLDDGDAYGENGSMSIICTLNATDYVTVRVTEGEAYGGSSGYTYFGGYLLS